MSVAELSSRSGVSVRNIRAYQTAGLLQAPSIQGRLALYSGSHLTRLALIRELRALGFGLDAISDMLAKVPKTSASPYSLIAQMFSQGFFQVEKPQRKTLNELTAHWDVASEPQQIERLLEGGLYRPVTVHGPGQALTEHTEFEVLSPNLWSLGKQMADLQIPLNTVLDLQDKLIEHCRALAQSYVDQFVVAMVREVMQARQAMPDQDLLASSEAELPPTLLRTIHRLIERLRPIAIGSVSAAFPVILQQEFDRDVVDRIQALVKQLIETLPPTLA